MQWHRSVFRAGGLEHLRAIGVAAASGIWGGSNLSGGRKLKEVLKVQF